MSERDARTLDTSLEHVWEKIRRVSDALLRLREENKALKERVATLEAEDAQLQNELQKQRQDAERLQKEFTKLQSNGSSFVTPEEKEELKTKLKVLISKINARL